MRNLSIPACTTASSEVNSRRGRLPQKNRNAEISAEIMVQTISVLRTPWRSRSGLAAPVFCPAKTEMAEPKVIMGMVQKESILITAMLAAITVVPKLFSTVWTIMFPMEDREF